MRNRVDKNDRQLSPLRRHSSDLSAQKESGSYCPLSMHEALRLSAQLTTTLGSMPTTTLDNSVSTQPLIKVM